MRNIVILFFAFGVFLHATIFNPNDVKKREVLKHFDIPLSFLNDPYLQEAYLQKKSETQTGAFISSFQQTSSFLPTLQTLIAQSDLPQEFVFIMLVESNMNPLSTSMKGASGLWQFMEGTGKIHGLAINSYVDERRDNIKSTRAAIAYLSQLHQQFGKWYLALIAYNCGDGRLNKAIRKAGTTDINTLVNLSSNHLPKESQKYIRKILALALLATEDTLLSTLQENKGEKRADDFITTVYLPEGENIDRIAAVLEMPKQQLKQLNTHLKKGITPPRMASYPVYIPTEKLDMFRQKFKPKGIKGYFVMHQTASNESLGSIANRYNVSKNVILDENMAINEEELKTRKRVVIPIQKSFIKSDKIYKVKRGDTLFSIARFLNISINQLKHDNPYIMNKLKEGEELNIGN